MKRSTRRYGKTLAARADKYDCYQQSVQAPEPEFKVIDRIFRKHRGRAPRSLREDFCGTAVFATAWVERHPDNTAIAIDLDPEPLAWGMRHNVAALDPDAQSRVKLVEGNVLDVGGDSVDVTVAFNFSYFLFRTRTDMLAYLRAARATLGPDGLLFLDAYGGTQAQQDKTDREDHGDFVYVWEQRSFDPINNWGRNFIHFEFPDGSDMRRAFAYDWRIWSIPELRELLTDAGFGHSEVYWEGTNSRTGEPNDVFTKREAAEFAPAWIAYLVASP